MSRQAYCAVMPYVVLCKSQMRGGWIAWALYKATGWAFMWVLSLGLALSGWVMLWIARQIVSNPQ